MTDAVLGIDVSKNTFDTNLGAGTKARSKSFANSPAGWHHLIAWHAEHWNRTGSRLSGGNSVATAWALRACTP